MTSYYDLILSIKTHSKATQTSNQISNKQAIKDYPLNLHILGHYILGHYKVLNMARSPQKIHL